MRFQESTSLAGRLQASNLAYLPGDRWLITTAVLSYQFLEASLSGLRPPACAVVRLVLGGGAAKSKSGNKPGNKAHRRARRASICNAYRRYFESCRAAKNDETTRVLWLWWLRHLRHCPDV